MAKIKAHEIRNKSKEELLKQLDELKNELAQLRVAKVAGGNPSRLAKIKVIRKSIARVLTVYNQTQRSKLRELYKNAKYTPLDLRKKGTRAHRRLLSAKDAARVTERQKKKQQYFPVRLYALKA
eukprot:GILI01002380.1.p1 GENE.GILI01002380.1~~GILI01002380.1.p1  ORF type:complete len:124 (+),score=35.87 GILI01002380.1:100-471(+)